MQEVYIEKLATHVSFIVRQSQGQASNSLQVKFQLTHLKLLNHERQLNTLRTYLRRAVFRNYVDYVVTSRYTPKATSLSIGLAS